MSTANLNAKITANAKQFHSQMGKVKNSTKSVGKIFAGLGAALSVGLAVRQISNFIDKLDEIGKKSKSMQITTDEFQQMSFAAERSGLSIENVESSMRKMSKTIEDARDGLSTAKRALEKLGLTAADFDGKGTAESFKLVIHAISLMESGNRKAAVSQELLGRSGSKLLPMMEDYVALTNEASNLGLISPEEIEAAEQLKDSFKNFQIQLMAILGNSGLMSFLNTTLEAFKKIAEYVEDINNLINFGNTNAEQRAAGGTGPGFDKSFLNLIGERLSDAVTFGLAADLRDSMGYGDQTSTAPINQSDINEASKELKINEKEKLDIIIAQGQQMVKDALIRGRQANIQSEENKKAKASKLKDAEAEDKKLDSIRLQTDILKARLNLDERGFQIKKFELELADKIKNTESAKAKELLKQQGIVAKTLLMKELDADNVGKDELGSNGKIAPEERANASSDIMTDRLQRIGGMLGGTVAVAKESPSDKKRNDIIKRIETSLDKVFEGMDSIGVLH